MTDYHTRCVSANVLLVKNGRVLLARRSNTGWSDGLLNIPGGHLEDGETASQAAIRETKEELGLDITADRLHFYASGSVKTNREYIYQQFYVELRDSEEPTNAEPDKCSELIWCDPHDPPDDTIDTFKIVIADCYVGGKTYFEYGY